MQTLWGLEKNPSSLCVLDLRMQAPMHAKTKRLCCPHSAHIVPFLVTCTCVHKAQLCAPLWTCLILFSVDSGITITAMILRFTHTQTHGLWPLLGRQQRELFAHNIRNTYSLTLRTHASPLKVKKTEKLFVVAFVLKDEHMKVLCVFGQCL